MIISKHYKRFYLQLFLTLGSIFWVRSEVFAQEITNYPEATCDSYLSTAKIEAITNTLSSISSRNSQYPFQVKLRVWRYLTVDYIVCKTSFKLKYEFELSNNNSRTVLKGDEVNRYIHINTNYLPTTQTYVSNKSDVSYPLKLTFTDKYYTDNINTYSLKIKVTATDFDNNSSTNELVIKPLIIESTAMRYNTPQKLDSDLRCKMD